MNNYRDLFYKDTYRKEYDNFFKEINNAESLGGETIARGLSLHISNELNSVEVDVQEIEESVNFINENIDFDISYFKVTMLLKGAYFIVFLSSYIIKVMRK